jgi:hypothetical protein
MTGQDDSITSQKAETRIQKPNISGIDFKLEPDL